MTITYCQVGDIAEPGKTDPEKEQAIVEAEWIIDQITRDHWGEKTLTLYLSGTGSYRLAFLPETALRCLSITTIINLPTPTEPGTAVDTNDYRVEERALNHLTDIWTEGHQNYRVIGVFGHSEVPVGIRRAAILLASAILKAGAASALQHAKVSERLGPYSYTREKSEAGSGMVTTGIPEVDKLLTLVRNPGMAFAAV